MAKIDSQSRDDMPLDWPAALAVHDRWLRTALYTRLRENHAVDEVMQEVSLAAVKQRTPLFDPSRVGAWLYRVALKQAMMHRRRTGRRIRLHEGYSGTRSDESVRPDPLALLLLDERRSMVRAAMEKLGRRDAEILLLKYTQDWSCRELAERLGVSESCVEARLHRARQRLRGTLARNGEAE